MDTLSESERMSIEEAAQYEEFKRERKALEESARIRKIVVDASLRSTDRAALSRACALVKRIGAGGILVSPVNVAPARRILGRGFPVICTVGGTGESLPAVKKTETKKAVGQGANEIRLTLSFSKLVGGDVNYLKKEIKAVKRGAKRAIVTLALDDSALTEEDVATGVRAAGKARAGGVCVRGALPFVLAAEKAGCMRIEASDVGTAEGLDSLLRVGVIRVTTDCPEKLLLSPRRTEIGAVGTGISDSQGKNAE